MRRRAILLGLATAAGCVPASESDLAFEGVMAAILVQTVDERVVFAREVPYPPRDPLVVETGTHAALRTSLLGYPQPLATYGIAVDTSGSIAIDPRGVPLPPPLAWVDLHPHQPATPVDPALVPVATAFPAIRVARAPCTTRLAEVGARIPFPPRDLLRMTMALPFGPDRMLLGVIDDDDDLEDEPPQLLVATSTARASLPIVFAGDPRGFVDPRDDSAWVFVSDLQHGDGRPGMCHFFPTRTASTSDCWPLPESGAPVAIIGIAGQRRADGRLEMVAMSWDHKLHHWLGDASDRGQWRALYTGGRFEDISCQVGAPNGELRLDGPGTGVASFETGYLERFTVSDTSSVTARQTLFVPDHGVETSCRSAYGRMPGGGALFVRMVEQLSDFAKPPEVWWQFPGSERWEQIEDADGVTISMGSVTVPRGPGSGDVMVVSTAGNSATVLQLDRRRLDLPPRFCPVQPVYNDARVTTALDDGTFILGGGFSKVVALQQAVARWEVVRD